MDVETEALMMEKVMEQLKDKTVIAITHRISTVKEFERIIVFGNGSVLADGTFNQLMENNYYFRNLYHTGNIEIE